MACILYLIGFKDERLHLQSVFICFKVHLDFHSQILSCKSHSCNTKHMPIVDSFVYSVLSKTVPEEFPDKTTANTGAVWSPHIDHSNMGICTSLDSKRCIQTSSTINPIKLQNWQGQPHFFCSMVSTKAVSYQLNYACWDNIRQFKIMRERKREYRKLNPIEFLVYYLSDWNCFDQDKDTLSSTVGCSYFWCWSCFWNDGCGFSLIDWGTGPEN